MDDRDRLNLVLDQLAKAQKENKELNTYIEILEKLLGVHLL
jgi:hypothetical protein